MTDKDNLNFDDEQQNNQDQENVQIKELMEKIDKLTNDLEKCQNEKQEYLDGWQRSRAEFINYQKENKKELFKFVIMLMKV